MNTILSVRPQPDKSFKPVIHFGTVISKPTGHFLVADSGRTIATSSKENPGHVYRIALRCRLKLVNITSQKGKEIIASISK